MLCIIYQETKRVNNTFFRVIILVICMINNCLLMYLFINIFPRIFLCTS